MKNLKDIIESQNFLVNKKPKTRQDKYDYHPTSKTELQMIIIDLLKQGKTDLNCIDVSNITYIGWVFCEVNKTVTVKKIDISEWDVSNVTNMECMFAGCENFNADISNWDVSNVKNTSYMFRDCKKFNADVSKWDVSNVTNMKYMFYGCTTLKKNNKIPKW